MTVRVFYLLSRFIVILHRCKWHAFLNWLPQIKQSVCCAIGEVKVINSCVPCIFNQLYTEPLSRVSTCSYGKTWQQRGQLQSQYYWTVRKDRQTDRSLCCNCWLSCCLLTERHKNQNSDVVSCIFVWKLQVGQLFVCLSLWNGEQSNYILW